MVETARVEGEDRGRILLYTLSTCVWCRMTKRFLNSLGVAYEYVDVDLLDRQQRREALHDLRRWNPRISYPTVVIRDEQVITGMKEDEIREALNHG